MNTIAPLVGRTFDEAYESAYLRAMRAKLGLVGEEEGDTELVSDLLDGMEATEADWTSTFHVLATGSLRSLDPAFGDWIARFEVRREMDVLNVYSII